MKAVRVLLVGLFVLVAMVMLSVRRQAQPDPLIHNALILQGVQALGELHTARYSYQDVFEYKTSAQPAQWVSYVPGGESVVQSATQNRALLSAVGSVEAGVDLKKARIETQNGVTRIVLPEPTLYEPTVKLKAHRVKPGWFWRDDNIGMKATEDAKARMQNAAVRQGILERANEEAVKTVEEFLRKTAEGSFEVVAGEGAEPGLETS